MTDTHSLVRTNSPGRPFIGQCVRCGKDGLGMIAALEPCPNPSGRTIEKDIVDAIEGEGPFSRLKKNER